MLGSKQIRAVAMHRNEPDRETSVMAEPRIVKVSRRIAASPALVFETWLDPEGAGRWLFATPEGSMVRVVAQALM